jgi:D-glycero-alpha-D-manno-heptose-7-phosphate kinase
LLEAWDAKRNFSDSVLNPNIENIYAEAIGAGAMSGKITGAGGGGFILLFVPPKNQEQVREALKEFIHVPFKFEYSGSQVIFADSAHDYKAEDIARLF